MPKKYLPYILLVVAALVFFLIRNSKKNKEAVVPLTEQTEKRITAPPVLPGEVTTADPENFNRRVSRLIFSKHARCRMDCRNIDESEVKEILLKGTVNHKKIQRDKRGITWPVEGTTQDGQRVRIVFAPKGNDALVVVTVIDLGKEWSCNCQ